MKALKYKLEKLFDYRTEICLLFALIILFLNAGRKPSIDICVTIFLCAAGLTQGKVKVDLYIIIPFILYIIFGFISSYNAHGNIADGYTATHTVFPVICMFASYLNGRDTKSFRSLCVYFSAVMALAGIGQFLYTSIAHSAIRVGGIIGNPNPFGMFLVISYFVFLQCSETQDKEYFLWRYIEPILLIALALTLSIGSFAAMAIGIVIIIVDKLRKSGAKNTFDFTVTLIAKMTMGISLGILLYLSSARSGISWLCMPITVYIAVFVYFWKEFEKYLKEHRFMSVIITALSLLAAIAVILIRPSWSATLTERIDMIYNGFRYLKVNPILGVGSYNWRYLNFIDSDKTFGTNHIHNSFINVGVELGIPAMLMMIIISLRFLLKKKSLFGGVTTAVFIIHNLVDVVFFNVSVTAFLFAAESELGYSGRYISGTAAKLIFAGFAAVSLYTLYWYIIT